MVAERCVGRTSARGALVVRVIVTAIWGGEKRPRIRFVRSQTASRTFRTSDPRWINSWECGEYVTKYFSATVLSLDRFVGGPLRFPNPSIFGEVSQRAVQKPRIGPTWPTSSLNAYISPPKWRELWAYVSTPPRTLSE